MSTTLSTEAYPFKTILMKRASRQIFFMKISNSLKQSVTSFGSYDCVLYPQKGDGVCASRLALAAASPFLRELLRPGWNSRCKHPDEIYLPDFNVAAIQAVVKLVHLGHLTSPPKDK